MLEWAVERALGVTTTERLVTVVAREHRSFFQPLAGGLGTVVEQPSNRGTAAGILLPLLDICQRDPDATVLLLPSDHFVADEAALQEGLALAVERARADRKRTFLLGIEPDGPDTEYGWIVPAGGDRVAAFVEKPGAPRAAELFAVGALWNAFMLASSARALVALFSRAVPGLLRSFRAARGRADRERALDNLYALLPPTDFSRDVLSACAGDLGLVRAPACGWTDLGTPARLLGLLERAV
jgi:mannose-1-phosphate guanylyltransferase